MDLGDGGGDAVWLVPSRQAPSTEVEVEVVRDALVTPLKRGVLRSVSGPRRWMTGAVHDATGGLVLGSQRDWNGDPNAPLAADPEWVALPDECRRLTGRWIYAGHWTRHFGHFLVEVLTNLWPDPAEASASGIIGHRSYRGTVRAVTEDRARGLQAPELTSWQRDLLDLAGYGRLKVRIVRERPVRVEELVVPSRPVLLKSWARPPAVDLWRRVADAVPDSADSPLARLFFSRARHHASLSGEDAARIRTSLEWERLVEERCSRAGYAVVHPEELPITRQIQLVKRADIIAGLSGSALHLSVFAPEHTRVLELGDERSLDQPMPAQTMIDAALGHRVAFVPYRDEDRLNEVLALG